MENNISNLIHEREMINSRMESMIYGSIEIREKSNNRYVYVHRRIDGIKESKYVGEYSNELYTMIVSNNELAKQYKSNIFNMLLIVKLLKKVYNKKNYKFYKI